MDNFKAWQAKTASLWLPSYDWTMAAQGRGLAKGQFVHDWLCRIRPLVETFLIEHFCCLPFMLPAQSGNLTQAQFCHHLLIKILQDKWAIIKSCKMSGLLLSSLQWLHLLRSVRCQSCSLSLFFLPLQLWNLKFTHFTFSLKMTFFSYSQVDSFIFLIRLVLLCRQGFRPSMET